MTETPQNTQPLPLSTKMPSGYHMVMPWISVRGAAECIEYLKHAFGAEELARVPIEDGTIGHAELRIGDSIVLMFDARETWPPTPALLRLYVDDAVAVQQRAVDAGGTAITEVTDLGFGERVGRMRDPFGNIWWIQEHVEDLTFEEMGQRAQEPRFIEAMRYAQATLDMELSSR